LNYFQHQIVEIKYYHIILHQLHKYLVKYKNIFLLYNYIILSQTIERIVYFPNNILILSNKAIVASIAGFGVIEQLVGYLTAVETVNNNTNTKIDLLAGGTAALALNTLLAHVSFQILANILVIGKYMKLKCFGTYLTNGAISTIILSLKLI
jgi:hypothetical protein